MGNSYTPPRKTDPAFSIPKSLNKSKFIIQSNDSILETAYRIGENDDSSFITQKSVTYKFLITAANGIFRNVKEARVKYNAIGVFQREIYFIE